MTVKRHCFILYICRISGCVGHEWGIQPLFNSWKINSICPSTGTWEERFHPTTGRELWTSPTELVQASQMTSRASRCSLSASSCLPLVFTAPILALLEFFPLWSPLSYLCAAFTLCFRVWIVSSPLLLLSSCSALMTRRPVANWSTMAAFVSPACKWHTFTGCQKALCNNSSVFREWWLQISGGPTVTKANINNFVLFYYSVGIYFFLLFCLVVYTPLNGVDASDIFPFFPPRFLILSQEGAYEHPH